MYKQLLKNGIESNVHYIPVFLHPFFKKYKFNKKKLLNSYKYYEEALSIPIYPNMSFKEQTKVINSIRKILK